MLRFLQQSWKKQKGLSSFIMIRSSIILRIPATWVKVEEGSCDGYSLVGDPECGDQMKLWIKVEKGRIEDIKFKSFGCPGAIATSSMATVLAKGKSLDEAKRLSDDDVVEAFEGIPDHKKHCSMMGVNALHAAIRDYEQKQKCPEK